MSAPRTDLTQAVLALLEGPLREVTFPGAGSAELERVVSLESAAQEAVAQAESALATARDALRQAQRSAERQAERTLAYARVYAADDPALLAAVEAASPGPVRRGPGRPRKDGAASEAASPRTKAASSRVAREADDAAAE